MIPALFQVLFAFLMSTALAFIFERPLEAPITLETGFAVLWLGALGSGIAYLVFFRLLQAWGATMPKGSKDKSRRVEIVVATR